MSRAPPARQPLLITDERTEMMLSEYSFPVLLEERERRLERHVERERIRRERCGPTAVRPALLLIVRRALAHRSRHARA